MRSSRFARCCRSPHQGTGGTRLSCRAKRDAELAPHIERIWQANLHVYGADKVWMQLRREGTVVARCTVERLMRRLGLRGVMRGKVVRTTVSDRKTACPLDRVNRRFRADRPNQLWVSDFTYVSTWQGWLYVAFVIDVYARRIVGGQQFHANGLCVECLGAGAVRPAARARRGVDPSF